MIVVADTSPLNYLIRLGYIDLLRNLHGRVMIPSAVLLEMLAVGAPDIVRAWAERLPVWIDVTEVHDLPDMSGPRLGLGEKQAIVLALRMEAELLLVDDRPARMVAKRNGIKLSGTLGVLKEMSASGLLDFSDAVVALKALGFRMTERLVDELLCEP